MEEYLTAEKRTGNAQALLRDFEAKSRAQGGRKRGREARTDEGQRV